jgi:hypothetical protein
MPVENRLSMNVIRKASSDALLTLLLVLALASGTGQVSAEVGAGKIPEHASAKSYGSGWTCNRGFKEVKGACVAVNVPANAHLTTTSHGRGWGTGDQAPPVLP